MKKKITKQLILEYYEDNSTPENGTYKGGPVTPMNFENLIIKTNKVGNNFQINIKGGKNDLEELGKYLINLANYETIDPNYHDHFDDLDNLKGNSEIIIHHPKSNWNLDY